MGAQSDLGLVVVGLVINVADQELDWPRPTGRTNIPKSEPTFKKNLKTWPERT